MQYALNHAELYDVVFRSRGKDFGDEATELANIVRSRVPGATTLLDVACGTAAHLETLAELFDHIEGVEYAEGMLQVARRKLPDVALHADDMRTFDLGRTFDAVICMGNSVACMSTVDELNTAVARMAAHIAPGGALIIEPWWFPDNFLDGHVGGHTVVDGGQVISRVTHSSKQGNRTRHEVKFVVADSAGIREFTDVLVVSLFTREQYADAFERAGCSAELIDGFSLDTGRPNSPGLFVGIRR